MTGIEIRIGETNPGPFTPKDDLPARRCFSRGPGSLSTTELLSLMIARRKKDKGPTDIASEILARSGSLRGLSALEPRELDRAGSLGEVSAARITAALELARRFAEEEVRVAETLSGAEEAYRFLAPRLRDLPYEAFGAVFLNQKHGVLSYRELFRGSVHASSVHPREVVKAVLKENAAAVILCHNHPSGHVSPSPDDLRLTEDLKVLLAHLDVRVVDHLILGGNGYFSFAREGLLSG